MNEYHIPVLLHQVVAGLSVTEGSWYIDATLGGGGFTREIVAAGGNVLGIDIDAQAIAESTARLTQEFPDKHEGTHWILMQDNFRHIQTVWERSNIPAPAGILFDLGVSSHQLDTPDYGISYRFPDAPLDFRLSPEQGAPLSELVNHLSHTQLQDILERYGEIEKAGIIAARILKKRKEKPLKTVGDLIQAVSQNTEAQPAVLSPIFQAFRMYINDEIGALKEGLEGAYRILPTHGTLLVISFHSLEDRIVKQFLRQKNWKQDIKRPIVAEESEIEINRRSRSAKLRIGEKVA